MLHCRMNSRKQNLINRLSQRIFCTSRAFGQYTRRLDHHPMLIFSFAHATIMLVFQIQCHSKLKSIKIPRTPGSVSCSARWSIVLLQSDRASTAFSGMEESLEATKDEESLLLSARCKIGFGLRMANPFDRGRSEER